MNTPADITVFILAAGLGKRMRPLTDSRPKPLLRIGNYSLIEHHLIRLKEFGFKNIIINIAHLGEQIIDAIDDGSQFDLNISYSDERESGALETAGGIKQVFDTIQGDSLLVLNGDIWTDFDFRKIVETKFKNAIVLTDNPDHNPDGDFCIIKEQKNNYAKRPLKSADAAEKTYTFTGIGLYSRDFFDQVELGKKMALGPLLFTAADKQQLESILHQSVWYDIGTPERLDFIRQLYAASSAS